jgi:hypothetical protein
MQDRGDWAAAVSDTQRVVIIEPGTVNGAMYDKGEKEDLSEFKQTEYWEAVWNFQKTQGSRRLFGAVGQRRSDRVARVRDRRASEDGPRAHRSATPPSR